MNGDLIRDIVLFFLGALLMIIGIAGNSLVVIAVWKKHFLRSTANYLLLNVAIAGIVSLAFLPLLLVGKYGKFQAGIRTDLLCKFLISTHIPFTSSFAAVFTLVVLSVEKYHAIVKPMQTGFRLREDTVKYAIIAVWVAALLLALPMYIFGEYKRFGNQMFCDYDVAQEGVNTYIFFFATLVTLLPFIVISFCYFQIVRELYFKNKVGTENVTTAAEDNLAKRKLVKLSLSISLALLVCFFPLAVTLCLRAYDKEKYARKYKNIYSFTALLYVLGLVLNPFLFAFQSTNFRQAFKEMLVNFKLRCYK